MAGQRKNINNLPVATTVSGSDLIEILQGSNNKQATLEQLVSLISDSFILTETVDIPASQVIQLHNTGSVILSAPGAGKFNRIINVDYSLIYNSNTYVATGTPQLQLYYGNARTFSVGMTLAGTFMTGTQSKITTVLELSGLSNVNISDLENKAIYVLTSNGAESWATGDGILRVRVSYLIIDI
jgi:hypothetical protein